MNDIGGSAEGARHPSIRAACFIVEDNPAVARFIAKALAEFGVSSRHCPSVPALVEALARHIPKAIFLDIALGDSDAVDAIRALSTAGFAGVVQLMSGSNTGILGDVRQVGERHGLRMRPALTKPFRIEAIKLLAQEENLTSGTLITRRAPLFEADPAVVEVPIPEVGLHEALDRNWLELWYQPKVDLLTGAVVGAEGLARVRHPELGLLAPGSFIPNASGPELTALAEFALRTALRDAADLAFVGHPLRLAINVPVDALFRLPIPAILRECRPRGDDWPGIILEVTEDQVIRDIPAAHEIATQLRIYRVALAIDDFGKGYSSLARLKELPFAELKLDKSFVQNCGNDPANAALCRTVVELAHRFGGSAVAEGIETPSELAIIRHIGCDIGQGFLFSHAMPKEFLLTRLTAGNSGSFSDLKLDFRPNAAHDARRRA